jgi:hypothetical protein
MSAVTHRLIEERKMALCKYRKFKEQYFEVIKFFFGKNSQFLKMEPNDEAYEVLETMLEQNQWAAKALALLPDDSHWAPGVVDVGKDVAKIGFALADQAGYIPHGTWCLPFRVKGAKVCLQYDKPKFGETSWMSKTGVKAKWTTALHDALVNEGTETCSDDATE